MEVLLGGPKGLLGWLVDPVRWEFFPWDEAGYNSELSRDSTKSGGRGSEKAGSNYEVIQRSKPVFPLSTTVFSLVFVPFGVVLRATLRRTPQRAG